MRCCSSSAASSSEGDVIADRFCGKIRLLYPDFEVGLSSLAGVVPERYSLLCTRNQPLTLVSRSLRVVGFVFSQRQFVVLHVHKVLLLFQLMLMIPLIIIAEFIRSNYTCRRLACKVRHTSLTPIADARWLSRVSASITACSTLSMCCFHLSEA